MKKLLCIVFTITLVLSAFGQLTINAKDTQQYDDTLYSSRLDALMALGIADDDAAKKSINSRITNKDFITMVANLTGYKGDLNGYMGLDVSNEYLYIDYKSAAQIMVSLLGWNVGNQVQNYLSIAQQIGLNDCVANKNDSFCTFDAVMMMYNSLTADMFEQTGFGTKNEYTKTGNTLVQLYKDAHYFCGRVIANRYSSMDMGLSVDGDSLIIDDEELGSITLNDNFIDTYQYLGMYVEGFYTQKGRASQKQNLICISYCDPNDMLVLNYTNQPTYDSVKNCISYISNGKNKTEKIDFAMNVIYNGEYAGDKSMDVVKMINNPNGVAIDKVIFADGDGNGKKDTMIVTAYNSMVVEGKSKTNMRLYGKNDDFLSLDDANDDGRVCIVDANGNKFDYADIAQNDVISIYQGLSDDGAMRLIISRNNLYGKINELSSSGGTASALVVTQDEWETELDEVWKNFANESLAQSIRLGDYYDIYLDSTGRIAHATLGVDSSKCYGVFIKLAPHDGGLNSNKIQLYMMTDIENVQSPSATVVDVASNATYNGVKITESNINQTNLDLFHTVITYYLNQKGEIKKIISADSDNDDALCTKNKAAPLTSDTMLPNVKKLMYTKSPCASFSATEADIKAGAPYVSIFFAYMDTNETGHVPINDVRIIAVPEISVSQVSDEYKNGYYCVMPIENREYFHNTYIATYKVTAYYEKGEIIPKFIIYTTPLEDKPSTYTEMTALDRTILVNEVSKVINPYYDTPCLKISGMFGGELLDIYTKYEGVLDYSNPSGYIDIGEGDAVFAIFDARGCITYGLRFYDFDPDKRDGKIESYMDGTYGVYTGYSNMNELLNKSFIQKGYIYNEGLANCGITIADTYEAMENGGKYGGIHGFAKPIKHIYIYDTSKKQPEGRVVEGNLNAGTTYFEDKTSTSTAVIRHRSGNCGDLIIYK